MRYIDRTGCRRISDRGRDSEIQKMGQLTTAATKIAENKGLGLLKTHFGTYRIIRRSGLGAGINEDFRTLKEVDTYLKAM